MFRVCHRLCLHRLPGLIPPTAGRASVFGNDISDNMSDIRTCFHTTTYPCNLTEILVMSLTTGHVMGVCPQHDVLWDDLTVSEHLRFFAGLKGVPDEKASSHSLRPGSLSL